MPDLRARELWAAVPLIALIIELGIYPNPALDVINLAVHTTLARVHSAARCRRAAKTARIEYGSVTASRPAASSGARVVAAGSSAGA